MNLRIPPHSKEMLLVSFPDFSYWIDKELGKPDDGQLPLNQRQARAASGGEERVRDALEASWAVGAAAQVPLSFSGKRWIEDECVWQRVGNCRGEVKSSKQTEGEG